MPKIIDGRKIAKEREVVLKEKAEELVKKYGRRPKLVAIKITDDPGSNLYLRLKRAAAERIGIEFEVLKRTVLRFGGQSLSDTDGIFLQHPLHFNKMKWQEMADQIPPAKDVDCLTTINLNLIKNGKPRFLPATVCAIRYCLLVAFNLDINLDIKRSDLAKQGQTLRGLQDKKVVILGRSPIVGLPLYWWLKSMKADVTMLGSDTKNIADYTKKADILISTTGHPNLITGDMVKKGVIVIDCGSPVGDVVFDEVAPKASVITPVPGGVGPLTVVSLMENVVQSAYLTNRGGS